MDSRIRLSPSEVAIYALVPKTGARVSSRTIKERFYRGKEIPLYGRQIVNIHLNALRRKGLINMSKRRGPIPIEVWR